MRLGADSYEKVELKAKESELDALTAAGNIEKVNDRITMYGEYDIAVNNHWDEDTKDVQWVHYNDKPAAPASEYCVLC